MEQKTMNNVLHWAIMWIDRIEILIMEETAVVK